MWCSAHQVFGTVALSTGGGGQGREAKQRASVLLLATARSHFLQLQLYNWEKTPAPRF